MGINRQPNFISPLWLLIERFLELNSVYYDYWNAGFFPCTVIHDNLGDRWQASVRVCRCQHDDRLTNSQLSWRWGWIISKPASQTYELRTGQFHGTCAQFHGVVQSAVRLCVCTCAANDGNVCEQKERGMMFRASHMFAVESANSRQRRRDQSTRVKECVSGVG